MFVSVDKLILALVLVYRNSCVLFMMQSDHISLLVQYCNLYICTRTVNWLSKFLLRVEDVHLI